MIDTEEILDYSASEPVRPTPDQIDEWSRVYLGLLDQAHQLKQVIAEREAALMEMVKLWGAVPPNAEKSRRLNGRLAELTVTKSDAITINFERVEMLREALEANGRGEYFRNLFSLQSKYEIVEGAEAALKTEALPKRLAEKVMNLFGRCINVKPKKPSLKVTIADPAKPAKKSRAKKEATR
jgi:hypothetical protein